MKPAPIKNLLLCSPTPDRAASIRTLPVLWPMLIFAVFSDDAEHRFNVLALAVAERGAGGEHEAAAGGADIQNALAFVFYLRGSAELERVGVEAAAETRHVAELLFGKL